MGRATGGGEGVRSGGKVFVVVMDSVTEPDVIFTPSSREITSTLTHLYFYLFETFPSVYGRSS